MVPGRTNIQCRRRWIDTLDPTNGKTPGKPRLSWKPEEDEKLTKAVKKHGTDCWVTVAAQVPSRTNIQCRLHWVNTLDPANGTTPGKPRLSWKPEEDEKLTEAVKKHGTDCWVTVAAMVLSRTNEQCRVRWVKTLDPANGKTPGKPRMSWEPEEDGKLTEAVKKHGTKCWVTVAAMVPSRAKEQCRQRWVKLMHLDRASNAVEGEHNDGNDEALDSVSK
jgi:hypothetical protein